MNNQQKQKFNVYTQNGNMRKTSYKRYFWRGKISVVRLHSCSISSLKRHPGIGQKSSKLMTWHNIDPCAVSNWLLLGFEFSQASIDQSETKQGYLKRHVIIWNFPNFSAGKKLSMRKMITQEIYLKISLKKRYFQKNNLCSTTSHKKWDFSLPVWYC